MPYFCVEKIAGALNDDAQAGHGSRVAILGVSYKAGVGDVRESPAVKIMRLLADRGAELVLPRPLRARAARASGWSRSRSTRCSTPTSS